MGSRLAINEEIASAFYGITTAIMQDKTLSLEEKNSLLGNLVTCGQHIDPLTIQLQVTMDKKKETPNGFCSHCGVGLAFDHPLRKETIHVRCPKCLGISNFHSN